ncbi:hypothetical protein RhiirA5_370692 [Rhizophagus irregularis]|uniref:Uncharacterized protein n=1 Tax=Rhizophagus irregularis TaxID=588596 RepID=A0A2N0Q8J9_9GLOM|nr:hypothetical protein RhiirA5_370692 [Rhizophagus irregularis]PKC68203.1 hypothetical protein RhiirA1_393093 [Rhizophagus irregularis]
MKEMGKYIHFSDDKHSIVNKENNSQLSIAPIPKPPVGPSKNHKTRAQEEPTLSNARKSMFQQNKTTKSRQINVSNVFTEKQPIDNITRAQEDQPADTDSEESAEDQQIEDDSNEKNERNIQCVC